MYGESGAALAGDDSARGALSCLTYNPESGSRSLVKRDSTGEYTLPHRLIPAELDSLDLKNVAGEGHTAHFNGGSDWAQYWTGTMRELTPLLLKSAYVAERMLDELHARYQDPHYWTSVITFTANWGRKPA